MVLSDEKITGYMKRLLLARMRLLCNNGFYGMLLMHMTFSLDEDCETASTDGKRIYFGPAFLDDLSDSELDFILMHEILHVVLQHCLRQGKRDNLLFNIACDIVVNSNILLSCGMNPSSITLKKYGESMHLTPDGREGCEFTAEQVYEMLKSGLTGPQNSSGSAANAGGSGAGAGSGKSEKRAKGRRKNSEHSKANGDSTEQGTWDDHSHWGAEAEDETLSDVWAKRLQDACAAISIRDPSDQHGLLPLCAKRLLKELKQPQTDWRTVLNDFVQEEICDFSFTPPDRRFGDCPFFMPDFNEKEEVARDILFMIDTSGSMSDDMLTAAYSEVKGAVDQFGGKLRGWLGFFDAQVVEPVPFADEEEFKVIKPVGGGGTDFGIIFSYVSDRMQAEPPASIIILTDGYAPFPDEKDANGIPVLWLLNNEKVDPPWGKVARITVES